MMRSYPAPAGLSDKDLKKFYNKKIVIWDNNYSYVNLPIACVVGIMYGGCSDYYGRKLPLLIGVGSVLVENAMKMLIWSPVTDLPLYWFYPTAVITGLMGDFLLTMSCVNAYVVDRFDDEKILSTRMIIVSIMFSLGSFIAAQCTKPILKSISSIAFLGIVEGGLVLSLSNREFKNKQINFLQEEEQRIQRFESAEQCNSGECLNTTYNDLSTDFLSVTKLSFISIYHSLKIFVLPREGHRRLFLYLTFGANFLDQLVFGEEKGLIGTYTLLPPFNWTKDTYADYKSLRPIVQIVGMFFGMLLLKQCLKLRDTFVICLAIGSLGVSLFMIGLAQATWLIFASMAPGSLHGLLNPLTYTFLSCLVERNEIGKAFAISSIAQKIAGFAQSAILQNIYIATLNWYQVGLRVAVNGHAVSLNKYHTSVHFDLPQPPRL
ncbi:unnamed protein product [Heligmosomoides polygyrus]|uniref:MFS domain-containing protein n=1 Tax=Heligmosomoides polygyrus TaxID=6339 RepID=A0A183FMX2_HELPZ|nr:unnamed protein product [Heligmosomoides polygyrus]